MGERRRGESISHPPERRRDRDHVLSAPGTDQGVRIDQWPVVGAVAVLVVDMAVASGRPGACRPGCGWRALHPATARAARPAAEAHSQGRTQSVAAGDRAATLDSEGGRVKLRADWTPRRRRVHQ